MFFICKKHSKYILLYWQRAKCLQWILTLCFFQRLCENSLCGKWEEKKERKQRFSPPSLLLFVKTCSLLVYDKPLRPKAFRANTFDVPWRMIIFRRGCLFSIRLKRVTVIHLWEYKIFMIQKFYGFSKYFQTFSILLTLTFINTYICVTFDCVRESWKNPIKIYVSRWDGKLYIKWGFFKKSEKIHYFS